MCWASSDRCLHSCADLLSLSSQSFVSLGLTWWEGVICTFVGGFFISCLVRSLWALCSSMPRADICSWCRSRRTVSSVRLTPRLRRFVVFSENFAFVISHTSFCSTRCSPARPFRYLGSCCIVSRIIHLFARAPELNSAFLLSRSGYWFSRFAVVSRAVIAMFWLSVNSYRTLLSFLRNASR